MYRNVTCDTHTWTISKNILKSLIKCKSKLIRSLGTFLPNPKPKSNPKNAEGCYNPSLLVVQASSSEMDHSCQPSTLWVSLEPLLCVCFLQETKLLLFIKRGFLVLLFWNQFPVDVRCDLKFKRKYLGTSPVAENFIRDNHFCSPKPFGGQPYESVVSCWLLLPFSSKTAD